MRAYARDDGLFDVEAHLVDTKPFDTPHSATGAVRIAGQPVHDLWVRLTLDHSYVVKNVEAASDVTPFPLCKQAEATIQIVVGDTVAGGWSSRVKQKLRGATGCTHLTEMLVTMATTAYQGIRALKRIERGEVGAQVVVPVDSCYAYASDREVVLTYWPHLFRGVSE